MSQIGDSITYTKAFLAPMAWDGTLLGKGDVHPTGGKNLDFSTENLAVCGYALRNYVTLAVLEDVIKKCF